MAQPFSCLCKAPSCRGTIKGAKNMTDSELSGLWINGHIRKLKQEQKGAAANGVPTKNGYISSSNGPASTSGGDRRGPTSREMSGEMGGDTVV